MPERLLRTSALTPVERSLRGAIAAETRWAHTSKAERQRAAQRGQDGLTARFEAEIDPDGVLEPDELAMRVENLRRAHMKRLALASAKARREAAAGTPATRRSHRRQDLGGAA